ncbi:DUF2989 domain-containing protein [Saccharobesus litoralis]|uniref:DUF2989 domain-containing protein n=1 Tax=Saccharobesus litoralis TaxID=2172099 RepID=A0A2S0VU04_9ALTE|nr:DUF2989 domain-containing protein [Saccharobesus litoralis]AWB67689.1 DUF2989 domain-containing protein [Saccharobesus litoralis]
MMTSPVPILKQTLTSVAIALILTGCDSGVSVRKVCKETPQFCQDLNKDSWCKDKRANVIIGRYLESQQASDDIRYQLILDLESYSECVEIASHIEHIKLKEKTTTRVQGYVTSLKELERLKNVTKSSNDPRLLYWHWSRNGDENALTQFLKLRETGDLETPDLQFKLATYWVKIDRDATIDILYHALALYKDGDKIDPEILKTLSTLYLKEDKLKHAYVWGRIAKDYGMKEIDLAPMKAILGNQGVDVDKLDDFADEYQSQIESGSFVPPKR